LHEHDDPCAEHLLTAERRSQSLVRRVGVTSVGVWGSTALAFVGTVVMARTLGPREFGTVALAIATAQVIAALLDLTLEQGVVHHGSRLFADGDLGGLRALIRTALTLDLAIGIFVTTVMISFAGPIAEAAGSGVLDSTIVAVAALIVLGGTVDTTTGAVLTIINRPETRAWVLAGTNLARLVGVIGVISVGGGATAVVGAYAVATAVGGLAQLCLAWRLVGRKWPVERRPGSFRASARKLLPFAVHSSIMTTLTSAADSLLVIILGKLSGPTAVAMFRIALLPKFISQVASGPMKLVMFSEQARQAAGGKVEELRRGLVRWSAVSIAIALPATVAGFFVLPWLIPAVYGQAYAGAVEASQIVLLAAFLGFSFPWVKNFPAIIGRPAVATIASLALVAVALPITLVFGEEYGPSAAAAGWSLGWLVVTVIHLVTARAWFAEQRAKADASQRAEAEATGSRDATTVLPVSRLASNPSPRRSSMQRSRP
jgi:O-antigen/teichoic acid export membrane protein